MRVSVVFTSLCVLVHASFLEIMSRTNRQDDAPLLLHFIRLSGEMVAERKGQSPLEIRIPRSATVQDLRDAVSREMDPPRPGAFPDFVFERPVEVQVQHTSTCLLKILARLGECMCNKRRSGAGSTLRAPLLATDRRDPPARDLEVPPVVPMMEGLVLDDDLRTLGEYGIKTDTTLQVTFHMDVWVQQERQERLWRRQQELREIMLRKEDTEKCCKGLSFCNRVVHMDLGG